MGVAEPIPRSSTALISSRTSSRPEPPDTITSTDRHVRLIRISHDPPENDDWQNTTQQHCEGQDVHPRSDNADTIMRKAAIARGAGGDEEKAVGVQPGISPEQEQKADHDQHQKPNEPDDRDAEKPAGISAGQNVTRR